MFESKLFKFFELYLSFWQSKLRALLLSSSFFFDSLKDLLNLPIELARSSFSDPRVLSVRSSFKKLQYLLDSYMIHYLHEYPCEVLVNFGKYSSELPKSQSASILLIWKMKKNEKVEAASLNSLSCWATSNFWGCLDQLRQAFYFS